MSDGELDEDFFDEIEDEDYEDQYDCGITYEPRGRKMVATGCALAGSEQCNFECPNRAALYRFLDKGK